MRIAIIGGGTSGVVSAWLLDSAHEVTLFERDSVLGGNIRTLGGNVPCKSLASETKLDAGVVEFDQLHFRKVHHLFASLGVETASVPITTGLFLADQSSWHAPDRLMREFPNWPQRLYQQLRHWPLARSRRTFFRRTSDLSHQQLRNARIGELVEDDAFGIWIQMLLMYAYSIPFHRCRDIGANLAVPVLRRFLTGSDWTRVIGGTWTYVERILDLLKARVRRSTSIDKVDRKRDGVTLHFDRLSETFDAVVIAVTPEQILKLLANPSRDEQRRFRAWRANEATTTVHRDTGIYERRAIRYFSEFDLFETASGRHGYNAYLNRLSGLPTNSPPHYSLAFGLEGEIDPRLVIHQQPHITPLYTVESLRWRDEILAANGENRTWYAGAWLGDGLQEGAVESAERVALALGGRSITSPQPA